MDSQFSFLFLHLVSVQKRVNRAGSRLLKVYLPFLRWPSAGFWEPRLWEDPTISSTGKNSSLCLCWFMVYAEHLLCLLESGILEHARQSVPIPPTSEKKSWAWSF